PERQQTRQNRGSETLVGRNDDNRGKWYAALARNDSTRDELTGNLEKHGTRECSRRYHRHRPAELDWVADFFCDNFETKHRGKGICEQRGKKGADGTEREGANV